MISPQKFIEEAVENIRSNLSGRGILACSGGQDSSLLAVLANMAVGDRVLSVFVDTGLIREGEKERVEAFFREHRINYRIIDASRLFLDRLRGVTDPEQKRKVIGKTFIDVLEGAAREFGADTLLQGTIAPDWIESGGSVRDTIKSHHNVGGLPEKMNLRLLEPLRDLYKDEVRSMSRHLGLPHQVQPFPGPGLAVRVIGEVTEERLSILRKATQIVEREVESRLPEGQRPWQYFAVLLPVRTTGVKGDRRTYGYTVAVRMVDSIDAMTGTFSRVEWDLLASIAREITNSIPEVNRVVYDITDKPPATIEWE